jgi:alpha/beta superfamily hydrolase
MAAAWPASRIQDYRLRTAMARVTTGVFAGPAGEIEYVLNEPEPPASGSPGGAEARGREEARGSEEARRREVAPGTKAGGRAHDDAGPKRVAVVCHPHPLHGGTLHTRLVFHAARALQEMNIPTLRFNFRGVGRSGGVHDHGRGEVRDLEAALDFMSVRYGLPLVLGGFSFGSMVALHYLEARTDARVERLAAFGLPIRSGQPPAKLAWIGPKLFISGTEDEFGEVGEMEGYVAGLASPRRLVWVEGADHFLAGRMDEFRDLLRANLDFERE